MARLAAVPTRPDASPVVIRAETRADIPARDALLDRVMGPVRFLRASERLREGQTPAIALIARGRGGVVGTVRLWEARACGLDDALMLGPLCVDPAQQGGGVGGALMRQALSVATARGVRAIVLVGDPEYYERFGFRARFARRLAMPGPFERHRLLGLELRPGALDHAHGVLRPARVASPGIINLTNRAAHAA